jgi:cell division protein FtsX
MKPTLPLHLGKQLRGDKTQILLVFFLATALALVFAIGLGLTRFLHHQSIIAEDLGARWTIDQPILETDDALSLANNLNQLLARTKGVEDIHVLNEAEKRRLLAPYFSEKDLADLPWPIVVTFKAGKDFEAPLLTEELREQSKNATLSPLQPVSAIPIVPYGFLFCC